MNDQPAVAISPLAIAGRLAAARNLNDMDFVEHVQREPRLPELLWFIQWISSQPGSIEKWALDTIDEFAPEFGPAAVHEESPALTIEERMQLWKRMGIERRERLIPTASWKEFDGVDEDSLPRDHTPRSVGEQKTFRAALLKLKTDVFREMILDAARESLAERLREMCNENKKWTASPPWWGKSLYSVLLEALDAHAARQELQIARTALVSIVFEKLDFAREYNQFIKIEGAARSGKTEAVKAFCAAWPGRVRLVTTPPGSCRRDLFQAIAEAFGLTANPETPTHKLKEQLEFVLKHGGLMLVIDEAHHVLPPPASSVATPFRLDWLRSHAVDRKRAVALVTTPQAFSRAVEKFKQKTGYNFDQLFGRVALNVSLPDETANEDLMEIVRVHGADFPEPAQRLIALRVAQAESYLSKIEAICCLARYIARRDNHQAVTFADVEQAIQEVIPASAASARPALAIPAPARPKQPLAVKPGGAIAAMRSAPDLEPVALEGPARRLTLKAELQTH
jgi:DNA transposition AAA+ family ATPase